MILSRSMGLILDRSKVIGVPKYVSIPLISDVEKWIHKSGIEWTVNRLKSIKVDLIRKKSGETSPSSTWISRSKKKGFFFGGSAGILEEYMSRNTRNFTRGLQLIQMYTVFYSSEVTPQQELKFMSSVNSNPLPHSEEKVLRLVYQSLKQARSHSRLLFPRSGELRPAEPLMLMGSSPNKRAPLWSGKTVPEKDGIIDSVSFLFESKSGYMHYMKYKKLYDPVLLGLDRMINLHFGDIAPSKPGRLRVGRIGLIQEAGYKLRAVANPGRIFQRVLEPVGDYLFNILKDLPWDCTFDQTKAVEPLIEALSFGKIVHCYDLSNATDLFPWYIQRAILDYLFPDSQYPQLFEDLAKGLWYYPGHDWIEWKVGQPLGLYPSFASFSIAHGLILQGLLGRPYNGEFYILGDDVVIIDEKLAESYRNLMIEIGCKISAPKSLASSTVAEFAGRLILDKQVVPMMKYRNISDDSFIDLARSLGPRSLWLFKPKQRSVITELSSVPEFLGGFGWNPDGKPLKDRLKDWIFEDPKPVQRLTGHTKIMMRNLLNSHYMNLVSSNLQEYGLSPNHLLVRSSLEQRVQSIVSKIDKALVPLSHLLGKNIDAVFNSNVDLPIDVSDSLASRSTTLEVYLRRLGLQ